MKQSLASLCLVAVEIANAISASVRANDFYVSPHATTAGPGSKSQPCDLPTALCGSLGRPGDTFWLRGGVYRIGHIETQIHGAAGLPITFRQMPGEHAQLVGSINIWGTAQYVIFRDFELLSGDTNRVSRQTGMGFNPMDVGKHVGIQSYAPNISFINLVVHDSVRSGFYTSFEATNTLIYGCIVYNTGWASPDNAEGHSFYLQGSGEVSDNIAFNSTGANFHLYSNGNGCFLRDLLLDGNVAFGAGELQTVRSYRDWIVGVDSPSVSADNFVLKHNMGYLAPNSKTLTQVQIGRENVNGNVFLSDNYWPQGLVLNNWTHATVSGNVLAPQNSDWAVELHSNLAALSASWNSNTYASLSRAGFHINSRGLNFSDWKRVTGYDSTSSSSSTGLTGTKVFVRPNRFESGRANIVIYNWDKLSKVPVNLCSALPVGSEYEVRNAEDFLSKPVRTGKFDGKPVELPMAGLTVAKPIAPLKTPTPTGPTFNVFVLLKKASQ